MNTEALNAPSEWELILQKCLLIEWQPELQANSFDVLEGGLAEDCGLLFEEQAIV